MPYPLRHQLVPSLFWRPTGRDGPSTCTRTGPRVRLNYGDPLDPRGVGHSRWSEGASVRPVVPSATKVSPSGSYFGPGERTPRATYTGPPNTVHSFMGTHTCSFVRGDLQYRGQNTFHLSRHLCPCLRPYSVKGFPIL